MGLFVAVPIGSSCFKGVSITKATDWCSEQPWHVRMNSTCVFFSQESELLSGWRGPEISAQTVKSISKGSFFHSVTLREDNA